MKRLGAFLMAAAALAGAALASRTSADITANPAEGLSVGVEAVNPWTSLDVNRKDGEFQFAIVSDRTGGHRAGVFSRAVTQLNLLQPEFVVSVGDLIEGGAITPDMYREQWEEFQRYASQLTMPFFYVAGNHDARVQTGVDAWKGKFGRLYHHFIYKNVLFLCLNAYDQPAIARGVGLYNAGIGDEQQAYVKKVLTEYPDVRWTLVFLHAPIWTADDVTPNGWGEVEKMLAGRQYTVFCGHVHTYRKYVRQGRDYYQLATTGGGSRLRGLEFGEFDHVVWATMKDDGPLLANVMLDSIYPEDLTLPVTEESGNRPMEGVETRPVRGILTLDGKPAAGVVVNLAPTERPAEGGRVYPATGVTDKTGYFVMTTSGKEGVVPGEYNAFFTVEAPRIEGEKPAENPIPERYRNSRQSGLKYAVARDGFYNLAIDLKSAE